MTLNEEYAATCKGFELLPMTDGTYCYCDDVGALTSVDDYTTSDAELGRMVKALAEARYWNLVISAPVVDKEWIIYSEELEEIYTHCWKAETINEAAMRACIALKLQVPDGDEQ